MKQNNAKLPVKYIGFYPVYVDRMYGTGIVFEQNATVLVPDIAALKLLRHTDMFERGEKGDAVDVETDTPVIDEKSAELERLEEENGIIDQIAVMDKQALKQFAMQNYEQNIDTRKNIETLRDEVRNMVAMFGAV